MYQFIVKAIRMHIWLSLDRHFLMQTIWIFKAIFAYRTQRIIISFGLNFICNKEVTDWQKRITDSGDENIFLYQLVCKEHYLLLWINRGNEKPKWERYFSSPATQFAHFISHQNNSRKSQRENSITGSLLSLLASISMWSRD